MSADILGREQETHAQGPMQLHDAIVGVREVLEKAPAVFVK